MRKDQDRLEKQLSETQAENRRLQEPLQKAREELGELQKQLFSYERDKLSLSVRFNFSWDWGYNTVALFTMPIIIWFVILGLHRIARLG